MNRAYRRRPFHERYTDGKSPAPNEDTPIASAVAGEESWRNSEGERLEDYGVDEVVDFYDEEEVPLGQLLEQKRSENGQLRGVGT